MGTDEFDENPESDIAVWLTGLFSRHDLSAQDAKNIAQWMASMMGDGIPFEKAKAVVDTWAQIKVML